MLEHAIETGEERRMLPRAETSATCKAETTPKFVHISDPMPRLGRFT